MLSSFDYLINFCKLSQFFHFANKIYNKVPFVIEKDAANESSFIHSRRIGVERPLEENKLKRELGENLPNAMLYSGGLEQGLFLNVLTAWALTDGNNETEKILAHEMKPALQNKNNMQIASYEKKDQAKSEAMQAEYDIAGNIWKEPTQLYKTPDGKIGLRMTEREKDKLKEKVVSKTLEWVYERKFILDEKEYIRFLLKVRDFTKRPYLKAVRTPYDKLNMEIDAELKRRLA